MDMSDIQKYLVQCLACDGRLPSDSQQPPCLAGFFGVSGWWGNEGQGGDARRACRTLEALY